MSARKRITGLRALYWLSQFANLTPGQIQPWKINSLVDELRNHVEADLIAKKRRAARKGNAKKEVERE